MGTDWFLQLWLEQMPWISNTLKGSQSDWRIIVTHYPPQFRQDDWARLAVRNSIDLIVSGHRHEQKVSNRDPEVGGAAWVISGGGGGITSEGLPRKDGNDDQYGFFDVTISKSAIKLEAISHSGILRSTTIVTPREQPSTTTVTATATSTTMTTTTITGTNTTTTRTASFRSTTSRSHHDDVETPVTRPSTSDLSAARRGHCGASISIGAVLLIMFGRLASPVSK